MSNVSSKVVLELADDVLWDRLRAVRCVEARSHLVEKRQTERVDDPLRGADVKGTKMVPSVNKRQIRSWLPILHARKIICDDEVSPIRLYPMMGVSMGPVAAVFLVSHHDTPEKAPPFHLNGIAVGIMTDGNPLLSNIS